MTTITVPRALLEQCAEGPPYKTATQLIEAAMVKAYKLRPPKE